MLAAVTSFEVPAQSRGSTTEPQKPARVRRPLVPRAGQPQRCIILRRRKMESKALAVAVPVTAVAQPVASGLEPPHVEHAWHRQRAQSPADSEPEAGIPERQSRLYHPETSSRILRKLPPESPQVARPISNPLHFATFNSESLALGITPLRTYGKIRLVRVPPRRDIYSLPEDNSDTNFGQYSREPHHDGGVDSRQYFEPEPLGDEEAPNAESYPGEKVAIRTTGDCMREAHNTVERYSEKPACRSLTEAKSGTSTSVSREETGYEEPSRRNSALGEKLDDLDRELLNLKGSPTSGPVSSSASRAEYDNEANIRHQFVDDEASSGDDSAQPLRKRRRIMRSNQSVQSRYAALKEMKRRRAANLQPTKGDMIPKTKKKIKEKRKARRQIPGIGELVLVDGRLGSPAVDDASAQASAELSDDPISQPDEQHSSVELLVPPQALPTRVKAPKKRKVRSAEIYDNFGCWVPKALPLILKQPLNWTLSCDGFQGKEAEPMGRPMPIKKQSSTRERESRTVAYFPPLTLVAENPSGEIRAPIKTSTPKQKKKEGRKAKAVSDALAVQMDDGLVPELLGETAVRPVQQAHKLVDFNKRSEAEDRNVNPDFLHLTSEQRPSPGRPMASKVSETNHDANQPAQNLAAPLTLISSTHRRLPVRISASRSSPCKNKLERTQQVHHSTSPLSQTVKGVPSSVGLRLAPDEAARLSQQRDKVQERRLASQSLGSKAHISASKELSAVVIKGKEGFHGQENSDSDETDSESESDSSEREDSCGSGGESSAEDDNEDEEEDGESSDVEENERGFSGDHDMEEKRMSAKRVRISECMTPAANNDRMDIDDQNDSSEDPGEADFSEGAEVAVIIEEAAEVDEDLEQDEEEEEREVEVSDGPDGGMNEDAVAAKNEKLQGNGPLIISAPGVDLLAEATFAHIEAASPHQAQSPIADFGPQPTSSAQLWRYIHTNTVTNHRPTSQKRREPAVETHGFPEISGIEQESIPLGLPDSTWKPRVPRSTGLCMEVDEDIIDNPSPVASRTRVQRSRKQSAQRRQSSQLLLNVQHLDLAGAESQSSQPASQMTNLLLDFGLGTSQESVSLGQCQRQTSLGSIILGSKRQYQRSQSRLALRSEIPDSQDAYEPTPSYFLQAQQRLALPEMQRSPLSRAFTTPVSRFPVRNRLGQVPNFVGEDITMSQMSGHTLGSISPAKKTPNYRAGSLLNTRTSDQKSLGLITRQASQGMGTLTPTAQVQRTRLASRSTAMPRLLSLGAPPPFATKSQKMR